MELQTVAVRFGGEKLASHTTRGSVHTLYHIPGGLYRVHTDEGRPRVPRVWALGRWTYRGASAALLAGALAEAAGL
jgi:hypothetical protein